MLKFTTAPWYQSGNEYDNAIFSTDSEGDEVIIVDQYWPGSGRGVEDDEEQIGNIELILNAPNMYFVLKQLLKNPNDQKYIDIAQSLIEGLDNNEY